jgi:hypothetical protein
LPYAKPVVHNRSNFDAFVSHNIGTAVNSRHPRRSEMAKKAKKTARLHKGKKLEAQKPLKMSDLPVVKNVDVPSTKLY